MQKINLSKKSNKSCEHCTFYTKYERKKSKGANPLGYCDLYKCEYKYWHRCDKFIWKSKYLGDFDASDSENGKYLCHRCKRELTDSESIARGFGEACYKRHIKELIKKTKQLF